MVYILVRSFGQLKKELIEEMIEPNAKIVANDDIAISSFVVKIIQAASLLSNKRTIFVNVNS